MASDIVRVRGEVTVTLHDIVTGETVRHVNRNLVVSGGLNILAQLVGSTVSGAWYVELGTGTTAASSAQTALMTPDTGTWRAITAQSASSSSATLGTIYPAASANSTWQEIGLFAGATSTAGSGTMVARVLSTFTKTSSQVATVSWTLTFSV